MQEELQGLSKQFAQSQRNQFEVEKQLLAKNQRLAERESELEAVNAKAEQLEAKLAQQVQSQKRNKQMQKDMMAFQRIVRDQNLIIEQLQRA